MVAKNTSKLNGIFWFMELQLHSSRYPPRYDPMWKSSTEVYIVALRSLDPRLNRTDRVRTSIMLLANTSGCLLFSLCWDHHKTGLDFWSMLSLCCHEVQRTAKGPMLHLHTNINNSIDSYSFQLNKSVLGGVHVPRTLSCSVKSGSKNSWMPVEHVGVLIRLVWKRRLLESFKMMDYSVLVGAMAVSTSPSAGRFRVGTDVFQPGIGGRIEGHETKLGVRPI